MLDELKELVTLINSLPQLALWIAIGLFAYKISIVGSIYGVIRYVAGQLFLTLRVRRNPPPVEVDLRGAVDKFTITHEVPALLEQLMRLRGIRTGEHGRPYIHERDILWLKDTIDAELVKQQREERKAA